MVTYPFDWKSCELGQCADIYQGGTPSTNNPLYWGGEIVWVTPSEITKLDSLYIDRSERTITQEGLANSSATLLPKGAILLCTRATIGDLAIASRPLSTNQGFKNLVCRKEIDNVFFAYLLGTYKNEMISKAFGTTFLEISKKEIEKIIVHIPPYEEQKKIAQTLSAFDTYIYDFEKLIEKKKSIREGALKDLLTGRTIIKGFEGSRAKYCIEEITNSIITGGTPSTMHREYYGGDIPWLSSTEIHQKLIVRPTTYITEMGLQNSSSKIAPADSVLIALAGQGKTRGTAAYLTSPMAISQSLAALVTSDKCDPKFLYYLIESMYFDLRELSSGDGGRGGLNKTLIKKVKVNIPTDIVEQTEIAKTLQSMDDEIENLESERDKIIQIRDGAMDDLLSGRIRLTD